MRSARRSTAGPTVLRSGLRRASALFEREQRYQILGFFQSQSSSREAAERQPASSQLRGRASGRVFKPTNVLAITQNFQIVARGTTGREKDDMTTNEKTEQIGVTVDC